MLWDKYNENDGFAKLKVHKTQGALKAEQLTETNGP